jgi:hypothetical protein
MSRTSRSCGISWLWNLAWPPAALFDPIYTSLFPEPQAICLVSQICHADVVFRGGFAVTALPKALSGCAQKAQCKRGKYRILSIHTCEVARPRAYQVAKIPAAAQSRRDRRKVEALFAELKNRIGSRRLRLHRMRFVREQFYLALQNLKCRVRLLTFRPQPTAAAI